MISKRIILKSLDDAIWKCGQRLTLNKSILKTFDEFSKSINGLNYEKAIFVDDAGKILGEKKGDAHSVPNDDDLLERLFEKNDNKPLHINHNHPIRYGYWHPNCLSSNDITSLFKKSDNGDYFFKSITMEDGFTGMRMTLVRGDNFKEDDIEKINSLDFQVIDNLRSGFEFESYDIQRNTFKELWEKRSEGLVPDSPEFIKVLKECNIEATRKALESEGYYDKLKKAQEELRKLNCKLTISINSDNSWYDSDEEKKAFY